jgi:hypothetical protein
MKSLSGSMCLRFRRPGAFKSHPAFDAPFRDLEPGPSPERVLGWRIAHTSAEAITLELRSRLIAAHDVVLIQDSWVRWATFVRYEMPVARVLSSLAGPVHRRAIRHLLHRAGRGNAAPAAVQTATESSRASSSSVSLGSAQTSRSANCPGVRALAMAEATFGWASNHASATADSEAAEVARCPRGVGVEHREELRFSAVQPKTLTPWHSGNTSRSVRVMRVVACQSWFRGCAGGSGPVGRRRRWLRDRGPAQCPGNRDACRGGGGEPAGGRRDRRRGRRQPSGSAVSVGSKSLATCASDRSPHWHSFTIWALNSSTPAELAAASSCPQAP